MAQLYDDYMRIRKAKKGEEIKLSSGEDYIKDYEGDVIAHVSKPTKNMNLDFYDRK